MSREDYLAKLRDPRWQKLRLEILERDRWQCRNCGAMDKTLHVHHAAYPPWSSDPWEADAGVLVALCETCHESEPKAFRDALYFFVRLLGDVGVRGSHDVEQLAIMVDSAMGGPDDVSTADALRSGLLWYLEERAEMEKPGESCA